MSLTGRLGGFILHNNSRQLWLTVSRDGVSQISRCLSCSSVNESKKTPHVKPPGKLKLMVEKKYLGFTDNLGRRFEARFPKTHGLYVLVKQGMKTFFSDTKTLYRVSTEMWKGKNQNEFKYRELEVYRQMPTDMLKVFPVLAIAALPFAPYFIFPIAYLFPRHLLCRHFWTAEQQSTFGEHYLRARVQHFPKVLHYMEKHSRDVKDPGHRRLLEDIIHELERKGHPTVEQLIEVRPVFRDDQPFGRAFLVSRHKLLARHLALGMGFATWGNRLLQQVLLVHNIDLALLRDGIDSLTPVEIRMACFLRGLNAAHCSDKDMLQYLNTWTQLGKHVDESTLSLLLHSPVLLAMNHPANASLLKI